MNDKKKKKKTFLILTITAYVVLAGLMIYRAQQSPGTCPFVSQSNAPTIIVPVIKAKPVTKAKEIKLPDICVF